MSGSGITEEYILTCPITETPTAADEGTYGPITFSATPGANGGNTVTTGPWTLTVERRRRHLHRPGLGRDVLHLLREHLQQLHG